MKRRIVQFLIVATAIGFMWIGANVSLNMRIKSIVLYGENMHFQSILFILGLGILAYLVIGLLASTISQDKDAKGQNI